MAFHAFDNIRIKLILGGIHAATSARRVAHINTAQPNSSRFKVSRTSAYYDDDDDDDGDGDDDDDDDDGDGDDDDGDDDETSRRGDE